jgi:hypothetical protein
MSHEYEDMKIRVCICALLSCCLLVLLYSSSPLTFLLTRMFRCSPERSSGRGSKSRVRERRAAGRRSKAAGRERRAAGRRSKAAGRRSKAAGRRSKAAGRRSKAAGRIARTRTDIHDNPGREELDELQQASGELQHASGELQHASGELQQASGELGTSSVLHSSSHLRITNIAKRSRFHLFIR